MKTFIVWLLITTGQSPTTLATFADREECIRVRVEVGAGRCIEAKVVM